MSRRDNFLKKAREKRQEYEGRKMNIHIEPITSEEQIDQFVQKIEETLRLDQELGGTGTIEMSRELADRIKQRRLEKDEDFDDKEEDYKVKMDVELEKVYTYKGKDYHVKAEGFVICESTIAQIYIDLGSTPDNQEVEITSLECKEGKLPNEVEEEVREDFHFLACEKVEEDYNKACDEWEQKRNGGD